MRLEELEVIPYSLPFSEPYVTARGELRERELVLVRIRAEGAEGLGEAAALSLRGGPGAAAIARQIRDICWPALTEVKFEPERLWSSVARCRSRRAGAEALAAVDIALHDLWGKVAGAPVWRLLGAESAHPVTCNATLPAANPATLRTAAERWAAEGFRTFKLKVGMAGDVTQVATVRETLGPDVLIRIDANGAWTVDQAIERLRAMARHTIELAEQPAATLEQMAELRDRTRIKLAADESVISARDARSARELGACEVSTVKLAKAGGLIAAQEIAEEIPIYLSSALEGPVGIAAAAHLVQSLTGGPGDAGVAHGLATERLFSESIGRGVQGVGDELRLGEAPGLGVEIDEEALAARQIRA
jgi:L-Ala-D/L-Glu epimerase / N-acetyl-D-glutamate racemase